MEGISIQTNSTSSRGSTFKQRINWNFYVILWKTCSEAVLGQVRGSLTVPPCSHQGKAGFSQHQSAFPQHLYPAPCVAPKLRTVRSTGAATVSLLYFPFCLSDAQPQLSVILIFAMASSRQVQIGLSQISNCCSCWLQTPCFCQGLRLILLCQPGWALKAEELPIHPLVCSCSVLSFSSHWRWELETPHPGCLVTERQH